MKRSVYGALETILTLIDEGVLVLVSGATQDETEAYNVAIQEAELALELDEDDEEDDDE